MKLKCEAQIIKITSVKTCRKAEFFGPDLHLPLERLEYNTHYTDTLYRLGYKARAVRSRPHESYISLHSVSHAFHFVLYGTSSWFTAYPHEERRHRARVSLARPLRFRLYSFLPSSRYTVSVAWVYLACNFLVDSRETPGKDAPKDAFDPTWTEVVASRRVAAASSFNAVGR